MPTPRRMFEAPTRGRGGPNGHDRLASIFSFSGIFLCVDPSLHASHRSKAKIPTSRVVDPEPTSRKLLVILFACVSCCFG